MSDQHVIYLAYAVMVLIILCATGAYYIFLMTLLQSIDEAYGREPRTHLFQKPKKKLDKK
jgi:hypothetical protein